VKREAKDWVDESSSNLRSALELVAIGAYGKIRPNDPVVIRWKSVGADFAFPSCRKRLYNALAKHPIKWFLKQGGWPETLYYDLCRFTHSRPDASDGALWQSNGPVYKNSAIQMTFERCLCVYATSYLLVKMGRPSLKLPSHTALVFELEWLPGHKETARAFEQLFE
jgi:hypothetical protein